MNRTTGSVSCRDSRSCPVRVRWAAMLLAAAMALRQSAPAGEDRGSPSPSAATPAKTFQDLLFLGRDRIVVLRLYIEVDGKPFGDPWRSRLAELFALADRDGDRMLSVDERRSPPSAASPSPSLPQARSSKEEARPPHSPLIDELRTLLTANGLDHSDVDPPDGRISLDELTAFAAHSRGGPFQTPSLSVNVPAEGATSGTGVAPGTILFKILDKDHDGRISEAELREGSHSLHARDFDGDGTASVDELDHTRSPFGERRSALKAADAAPIAPISLEAGDRDLVRTLLRSYGVQENGGNEAIPAALFGVPEAALSAYDQDGNGSLDRREVGTFLAHPVPHVQLALRLGDVATGRSRVEILKSPSDTALTVKATSLGFALVAFGDLQLEVSVSSQARTLDTMKTAFSSQFKAFDVDGNGYVDQTEGERSPLFKESFGRLDRDADGKIFEPEMAAVVEGPVLMGLSRTRMTASNRGKDLLEILDANRDERLSQRELLTAVSRFELWDANGDKFLSEAEVPQLYQMVLQRGLPDLPGLVDSSFAGTQAAPSMPLTGPDWFQRMDRNGDGDLAPMEFLGTDSQFRELDRDSNGLIDADEALRLPKTG